MAPSLPKEIPMRKKMILLALSLAALAGSLSVRAEADGTYACPQCITYANGSQCCVSCVCDSSGFAIACTQNICPPDRGGVD